MELDLRPGESMVWTGAPAHPPTLVHYRDFAPVLALGAVSYAVIFYGTTLLGPGLFTIEALVTMVLVNLGLAALAIWPFRQARKATYAVTTRRLVVRIGEVGRSVPLASLGRPVVSVATDGIGTVWFGDMSMVGRVRALFDFGAPQVVLREVEQASQVATMVFAAQQEAR
jgi:hypothetical protein